MGKEVVQTDQAPAAIGPYSQAVKSNGMVFISGQIPLDPKTGKLVAGDIQQQTRQVLRNLQAIVEAAGTTLAAVVKTTVFIADMDDFVAMNEVYASFFEQTPPARACVEVSRLPKDVAVEIEAVALY